MILRVESIYSTWQSFRQTLLVDSLLLSYIDVMHANFLPPRLTIGEARELGKRYTYSDELAPLQDEFVERVSRHLRELAHKAIHEVLVQDSAHPKDLVELEAPVVEAEQFVTDLPATDSLPREEMVTRKTITIDHFVPDARQATQPPPPYSQTQVPPPPPPPQAVRVRKRQKVADQPPTGSGDVVTQTPPQPTGGIVIQEPQTQVGPGIASSSQLLVCGCGRKAKEAVLLRPWLRASFYLMMYMPLKRGWRSLWGTG